MDFSNSIFNDKNDFLNTSHYLFYELLPFFMDFYSKKKYSIIAKLSLYGVVQFIVYWSRCSKKYVLKVKISSISPYQLVDDDKLLIDELQDYFQWKNIVEITNWYNRVKDKKNENII